MILEQGYSNEEDYWEDAVASYRSDLALINIRQSYLASLYPNGATEEQEDAAMAAYEKSLRQSTTIDWKDAKLKAKYDALTVSESDFDETGQSEKPRSDSGSEPDSSDNDNGDNTGDVSSGTDTGDTDGGVSGDGDGIDRPEANATPITIF